MTYKNNIVVNTLRKLRDLLYYKKGKSIIIITLPKSGTAYILSYLLKGLRYKSGHETFSSGFPNAVVHIENIKTFLQGGYVGATHMPSDHECLEYLYKVKKVVHMRDPRQATLSWTHFVQKHGQKNLDQGYKVVDPETKAPPEYLDWPLEKKLDFMIDNYLPVCVTWIENWLRVIDDTKGGEYLLLTYEEFLEDNDAYFNRILNFYKIPDKSFQKPDFNKVNHAHYRSGKKDEWLTVFTDKQKEKAAAMVPGELIRRFNWPS